METNVLRKMGLAEQEIKIYLALLRFGSVTATKIASETNIDRATTYRFLTSLIDRGLVSSVITNNVRYFNASHPKKLVDDLKEKINEVQSIMPELESLINIPKKESSVEIYKGKEGLKAIMKDILRGRKPYTFIGEVEHFYTDLAFYIDSWLKEIEKKKINGRLICNEKSRFTTAKTENYRLISKEFISKISTWTYGDKTALFIWSKPPFGVLIENDDVTQSNFSLFNFLWGIAKEPGKKHLKEVKIKE